MSTVFTIGYEGTDIVRFVQTLQSVGIEVLADVRAVPLSRKKGFSKNALKEAVEAVGIKYESYQELGDPKPGREAAKAGNFDEFRLIYTRHIESDTASKAVKILADLAGSSKTCLLCFERDPKTCHRRIVAEKLKAYGFSAIDLYGDSPSRYERNAHQLNLQIEHITLEAAE